MAQGGRHPEPHVWQGMPVQILINNACNFAGPEQTADIMYPFLQGRPEGAPGFYFFRIVWVGPSQILRTLETLRQKHPDLEFEVVDPYTFFRLFKLSQQAGTK